MQGNVYIRERGFKSILSRRRACCNLGSVGLGWSNNATTGRHRPFFSEARYAQSRKEIPTAGFGEEQSVATQEDLLMRSEMQEVRSELRAHEQRMIIKLGGILAVGLGLITASTNCFPCREDPTDLG